MSITSKLSHPLPIWPNR